MTPAPFAQLSVPVLKAGSSVHRQTTGAIPAVIAANLIWGLSFVATKPLLDTLPPATLGIGRLFFALFILLPVIVLTDRPIALGWAPAMLGASGIVLTLLLQNMGLERTSATNASCLAGAVPAIAVVLAFVLLRKRPGRRELFAVALSVAGVMAIVLSHSEASVSMSLQGDLLMLASAASLAAYLVLGSRYFSRIDPISLVAGSSIYGMLMLLPVAGLEASRGQGSLPDAREIAMLVFLGAGASAVAYCLEGRALSELGASPVAMFGNLAPAAGIAASAFFLRESVSAAQVVGAVLVIAGAAIVTRPATRPRFLSPASAT